MRGFLFSPGVFMESWGPCNLRKWRKFKILIAPSWRKSFSIVTSLYHDRMKITISPRIFYNVWCFCKLQILKNYIILPQTSHRFQSNEVPFLKLIFVYLNIKLSHSVNGSNVWRSFGTLWWRPPLVQMEYLTTKGNWHNWRQSANHPGKKIIANCPLEFSYSCRYYSPLHGAS